MKHLLCVAALLLVFSTCPVSAQSDKASGSPEFERMKSLAGAWVGKIDMGQGPVEIKVEYRIVAGGKAIEERDFAQPDSLLHVGQRAHHVA
jgi:hypothetical protein